MRFGFATFIVCSPCDRDASFFSLLLYMCEIRFRKTGDWTNFTFYLLYVIGRLNDSHPSATRLIETQFRNRGDLCSLQIKKNQIPYSQVPGQF